MWKLLICLLLLAVLPASSACAEVPAGIPAFCELILAAWNAATPEALHDNICRAWAALYSCPEDPDAYAPLRWPCTIRLGGTTAELLQARGKWDLAIVDAKDVDLQRLAEKDALLSYPYLPETMLAEHQWLLPAALQAMLPDAPRRLYAVYAYDYDPKTGDAVLLLCGRRGNDFAQALLYARRPEQVRRVEGISRAIKSWRPIEMQPWTAEELIARAGEWDYAVLTIQSAEDLTLLDRAGLLCDLSQDAALAARDALHVSWADYRDSPKGLFSADGRMIAVPVTGQLAEDTQELVLLVNAQSPNLSQTMAYVRHTVRTTDWFYAPDTHPGAGIDRSEMTW